MPVSLELLFIGASAFGLGLLHGLGPDHLAAITSLISRSHLEASQGAGAKGQGTTATQAARLGLSFGTGHMLTLALIGGLGLGLGWVVPEGFERGAEIFGGCLLLLLGGWLLLESYKGYYHFHAHRHESGSNLTAPGMKHFHWHAHTAENETHTSAVPPHRHAHRHPHWSDWLAMLLTRLGGGRQDPGEMTLRKRDQTGSRDSNTLLMGGLFALSGLRSLILMVPVMVSGTVMGAALVVVLFGAGIILSMGAYGMLAARAYQRLGTTDRVVTRAARFTALVCVLVGVGWISMAW